MNELENLARAHDLTTMGGWRDNGDPAPYWEAWPEQLLALAKAIEAKAAAKEREACFNVCNRVVAELLEDEVNKDLIELAVRLRDAIRARNET